MRIILYDVKEFNIAHRLNIRNELQRESQHESKTADRVHTAGERRGQDGTTITSTVTTNSNTNTTTLR